MNRKEFIKTCSYSCLAFVGLSTLLESCVPPKSVWVTPSNNQVAVERSEFLQDHKWRRWVLVKMQDTEYNIVLYRLSDIDYSALQLACTHQANALHVSGDILTCSAHGSQFTNRGEVIQGPAELPLKKYRVNTDEKRIYIHLA